MSKKQDIKATDRSVQRRKRGFERAATLAAGRSRSASESRGFAVSRLLTHWSEIVGPDVAERAQPVDVKYGRGFGATLTVLTTGAEAPMVEMQKDRIRDRVNACYGYAAIQKVRITQTAASGFADGKPVFGKRQVPKKTLPPIPQAAVKAATDIKDTTLRSALERLGANVLADTKK